MEWYYSQNEQAVGPFDGATLQKLITAGVISSEMMVYNAQLSGWMRLADCMPPPESSTPPQILKTETRVRRATENHSSPEFPRKAFYAIACMVVIFVIPHLRTHYHWMVVLLVLGFAFGGVEFSHLELRDVKPGRPGHKYRYVAFAILVCAYLVLILMIAMLIIGFVTAD